MTGSSLFTGFGLFLFLTSSLLVWQNSGMQINLSDEQYQKLTLHGIDVEDTFHSIAEKHGFKLSR